MSMSTSTDEDEAPVNGDNGPSIPPPPSSSPAANPQVAAAASPTLGVPNIAAILEAANDLRKMGDILENNQNAGGSLTPTLDEIADVGEEPVYDTYDSDSLPEDTANGNGGRSAYTAETVAAISSLMKGEESPLFWAEPDKAENGSDSPGNGDEGERKKRSVLKKKEITLQDRATAMISVYKDFIQEEEEREGEEDHEEEGGEEEEEEGEEEEEEGEYQEVDLFRDGYFGRQLTVPPTRPEPAAIPPPLSRRRPSWNGPHALRREELKKATLKKFHQNFTDDVGRDSDSDDSYGDIDSDDEDMKLHGRRRHATRPHPSSKPPKTSMRLPTAATTTAAFRLKAEVALKAAAGATGGAVGRAAGAVRNRVRGRTTKAEDIQQQVEEVEMENDYDFRDYVGKVLGEEASDILQDGRRDDMEYGIPTDEDEGEGISYYPHEMQNGDEGSLVYGMHILDRDNTLKRKCITDDEEGEAIGIFNDLCDELGVTPATHPGLRHFYRHPRSTRYRYPVFRTKKFKRSVMYGGALVLLLLVVVSLLSAVSNGFEKVRKKKVPPLPDWQAEESWREQQKREWEKDHAGDGSIVGVATESAKQLFQRVSSAYRPVWYDRTTGWTGRTYDEAVAWCDAHRSYIPCPYEVYCPDETTLIAGTMDEDGESWAPVINAHNEWVQVGAGTPCELYSNKYGKAPEWSEDGGTGAEGGALTRHVMCCRAHPLLNGKGEGEHDMARPAGPPLPPNIQGEEEWDEQVPPPPAEAAEEPDLILTEQEDQIQKTYRPVWYNAEFGWAGTTYDDARAFCESIPRADGRGNLSLCPQIAYCPNGPIDTKPLHPRLDAFKGVQWAPISNLENDWIMIGKFNEHLPMTCETYLTINHKEPEWGWDGTSPELKENILCCEDNAGTDGSAMSIQKQGAEGINSKSSYNAGDVEQPGEEDGLSSTTETSTAMTAPEMQIQVAYHPTWFHKEMGWQGTTYNDARAFCESIPHGEGTLHLCPLDAYCPNGPRDTGPLYLQMDAFDGVQWAPYAVSPIGNGVPVDNLWLMIGDVDEGQLVCQTYLDINHRDPTWGLDGTSTQLKGHILCCEDDSGNNSGNAQIPITTPSEHADDVEGDKLADTDGESQLQEAVGSFESSSTDTQSDSLSGSFLMKSPQEVGSHASYAESVLKTFSPIWFDIDLGGWDGGSHNDAIQFCEQFPGSHGKRMELCPYTAYCPNGPTQPVIEGRNMPNFDSEGEQWAPVYGKSNHWVMIGKREHNSATTCLNHEQLEDGKEPQWGLDDSNKEMKKHVMCCSPLQ